MDCNGRSWVAAAPRFLYTHNPFYLISALLVLYGLHRSASAAVDWNGDELTIGMLFGYTLLLAILAFAIVRLGKVWDDARTILLVIVLLFLAISVRFDLIALRDLRLGGTLLLAGLVFAIVVSEGLLRGLGIRLAWMYRGPYYLLLGLMFAYPAWLAKLSIDGQDHRMAWGVFLFPVIASAVLLTLWPAARWGGPPGPDNRTPWRWPWFPWSLFTVIAVGTGLRTYWLSMSFGVGKSQDLIFQPYFLIPQGLVVAFLLLELSHAGDCDWLHQIALWAPVGLLLIAFPGHGGSRTAIEFLIDLRRHLGSPAQLALAGLIVFYAIAWARERTAEWGMMGSLVASAWVNAQTVSLSSLATPAIWPLHLVAAIQLVLALQNNQLARAILSLAIALTIGWSRDWCDLPRELGVYCAMHALIMGILIAGWLLDDVWARRLRSIGAFSIPIAAMIALATNSTLFQKVPRSVDVSYVAMLVVISVAYWYRTARMANLIGAFVTIAILATIACRQFAFTATPTALAHGWPCIAWGSAFLLIAVGISSMKGGAIHLVGGRLSKLNENLRGTKLIQ